MISTNIPLEDIKEDGEMIFRKYLYQAYSEIDINRHHTQVLVVCDDRKFCEYIIDEEDNVVLADARNINMDSPQPIIMGSSKLLKLLIIDNVIRKNDIILIILYGMNKLNEKIAHNTKIVSIYEDRINFIIPAKMKYPRYIGKLYKLECEDYVFKINLLRQHISRDSDCIINCNSVEIAKALKTQIILSSKSHSVLISYSSYWERALSFEYKKFNGIVFFYNIPDYNIFITIIDILHPKSIYFLVNKQPYVSPLFQYIPNPDLVALKDLELNGIIPISLHE